MFKNTASQKVTVLVIDVSTNTPKTGDAANLTAYVSKDDGSVTVLGDTSATELDATNAPGLYAFDLTQGETNADKLLFSGKSTTANIKMIPLLLYSLPPAFGTAGVFPSAVAGAAGGLFIAGSNAATTISGLTTGALSCTTITASGAVAFQSTFAVTTSTSLAALSCTTLTASGAVAFQSTLGVTGTTTLAALTTTGTVTMNVFTVSGATTLSGAVSLGSTLGVTGTTTLAALTTTGTMTVNAFTCTNVFTVSGATTLTGTVTATNASNSILGVTLGSTAFDAILIESGISAGAGLTNDATTQLTSINARQALSLCTSVLAGVLSGAATTTNTIKQAGKPAGASRVVATVDSSGNRSGLTLIVPT